MFKVVIIGSGIGGLTAAIAFAQKGADVTVLEQAARLGDVGGGLQISPNGGRVLNALGLSEPMAKEGVISSAIHMHDGLTGESVARLTLTQSDAMPYRFVRRPRLIDLLLNGAKAAGARVKTGCHVREIETDGRVLLSSGSELSPDLAIDAGGLNSVLRPLLNGRSAPFFTGQAAWRAVIPSEGLDFEVNEARAWMLPGRHMVAYPLRGGLLNIVAVREQSEWVPEGWMHPDVPEALRAAFTDACPAVKELQSRIDKLSLWGLFRHNVAARWVGPQAALLGDAAHPTLPFLAQGANMAIEDAWVLADCVYRIDDLSKALTTYQTIRRPRAARAVQAANSNAKIYHMSGVARIVLHGGLRLASTVSPGLLQRKFSWLYDHDVTGGAAGKST
ncbi:MAG: FAD-dependent monooxygenase [Rhodobacteraceae bacterium]|nr:FAD-dependent monooxygenase [Paracoccaceae bacterium]